MTGMTRARRQGETLSKDSYDRKGVGGVTRREAVKTTVSEAENEREWQILAVQELTGDPRRGRERGVKTSEVKRGERR